MTISLLLYLKSEMALEIERKFLINSEKWEQLKKPAGTNFKQGYLVNEKTKTVRIRIAGNDAYITIKGQTYGFSRKEYEYGIPVADATELLDHLAGSVIEKVRYCIKFAGKLWEVDVFAGDNTGLVVAEIELDQENEKFELPDWVAGEVTGDKRYYNSVLAVHPFTKWIV